MYNQLTPCYVSEMPKRKGASAADWLLDRYVDPSALGVYRWRVIGSPVSTGRDRDV